MDYFPLSVAEGDAFCNRVKEQEQLLYNIQQSRPTLISSPRRYGKTSLALQAIKRSKVYYCHCDFLAAINEQDVERILFKGIGRLLGSIESTPQKLLKVATEFFSGLSIQLAMDKIGLLVKIEKSTSDPASNILNLLERVESLSKKYKKKIVLFFDEFQRLYQVADTYAIESVIRQVAQSSKSLSFIFAGSNRHLLNEMFEDKNRPFYKLCERISVARMSKQDYFKHIQHVSHKEKRSTINEESLEKVCDLTERHPYYINLLLSRLWKLNEISTETVEKEWCQYIAEERSQIANELDLLSSAQRKLLTSLARHNGTSAPRSSNFQVISEMPGTTINQALKVLEKKDYVFKEEGSGIYKLIDPSIKWVLNDI